MNEHLSAEAIAAAARRLRVARIDAIPIALALSKPVKMAAEIVTHARNILVRIETENGLVGWGEAASAPTMTGDTLGGLKAAVDHLAPLVVGVDIWDRPALIQRLKTALYGNTGAHSAIEMALLDLAGHAVGAPLVDLLGGKLRERVAPMWLVGNDTLEKDIAEARAKEREGFHFFKLKVGTKSLDQDIAASHALRATLGRDMPICADANGGFTLDAARRYLAETSDAAILFLEQPLPPTDLAGLATLARDAATPIGADEGIHSLADIERHAAAGAGGLSLKFIKLGGMTAAIEAAALCRKLNLDVNVACKIAESSIGSAAAVHYACAIPTARWGVSLTHFYLAEDIVKRPLRMVDGEVMLPSGPGLGVEVDEAAVARFAVRP